MYRVPLHARLQILRLPCEYYRYQAKHPRLIRSPKFALGKADEDYSYDPMSRPGIKEQFEALDALQELIIAALNRDAFTQWLNSKEDWEELGVTNCTDPLETFLKTVISKEGYKVRVYTKTLNPVDNTVSEMASGEYQINAWAQEISVIDHGVCLDGFELVPPIWATCFMVEVENFANLLGNPDGSSEVREPLRKGECLAIMERIPV